MNKLVDTQKLNGTTVYRFEDIAFEYVAIGYDIQYDAEEETLLILPFYETHGCIHLV